jgi:hypothetical protein
VRMASGSPTVGLGKLLLHKLFANFPALVGLRVDIEVPPTALQLESLRIRKDRLPIDRTSRLPLIATPGGALLPGSAGPEK